MSIIKASVDEQIMTITNNPLLASGSANTNKLMITFDSEWEGYLKTAVFYQDIKKPYFAIMENNTCVVPWEVLENDGILCMGVFGVKENSRITTVINKYKVFKGALTSEMGLQPPTMDVWQQILSALLENKALVQQIKDEQAKYQAEWSKKVDKSIKEAQQATIQCHDAISSLQLEYFDMNGGDPFTVPSDGDKDANGGYPS